MGIKKQLFSKLLELSYQIQITLHHNTRGVCNDIQVDERTLLSINLTWHQN